MLNKFPDAKYHSYGKTVAKSGRKMGHISLCNLDREILETTIAEIKHQLEI
jgi:phosphoribosylaminoimidazole carboxylase (NCAIR synthetase)